MKTIALSDLMKCPKLWHELIPLGKLRGGDLDLSDDLAIRLSECGENIPVVVTDLSPETKPIPREQWPIWAALVALKKNSDDKGVGDTIARTIGPVGGDAFKTWYLKIVGKSCGCSVRQEYLNQIYPYPKA